MRSGAVVYTYIAYYMYNLEIYKQHVRLEYTCMNDTHRVSPYHSYYNDSRILLNKFGPLSD